MRVACRIAVTWSFRANMIKGQGGVHAPCEFLSGEALRAMPPDPSAKKATEVQEGVVAKTIKSLGEAMVKLRELACYDKGLGQPIVMLSDTGTRTKRQRLRKGGGQSFSARITNVGPNGDTVWASVIVPPEQTANPTAPGGKSRHFTARLRPHLYPRHDKPIVAALESDPHVEPGRFHTLFGAPRFRAGFGHKSRAFTPSCVALTATGTPAGAVGSTVVWGTSWRSHHVKTLTDSAHRHRSCCSCRAEHPARTGAVCSR